MPRANPGESVKTVAVRVREDWDRIGWLISCGVARPYLVARPLHRLIAMQAVAGCQCVAAIGQTSTSYAPQLLQRRCPHRHVPQRWGSAACAGRKTAVLVHAVESGAVPAHDSTSRGYNGYYAARQCEFCAIVLVCHPGWVVRGSGSCLPFCTATGQAGGSAKWQARP